MAQPCPHHGKIRHQGTLSLDESNKSVAQHCQTIGNMAEPCPHHGKIRHHGAVGGRIQQVFGAALPNHRKHGRTMPSPWQNKAPGCPRWTNPTSRRSRLRGSAAPSKHVHFHAQQCVPNVPALRSTMEVDTAPPEVMWMISLLGTQCPCLASKWVLRVFIQF
jgi:hypothetical protein